MGYSCGCRPSWWFIVVATLGLIAIAIGGCQPIVSPISVRPNTEVVVGGKLSVSVSVDNPPKGKVLRYVWSAKGEAPSENLAGGMYVAPDEPGLDVLTCEVWGDSELLAIRTATIEIVQAPSSPPSQPEITSLETKDPDQTEAQEPEAPETSETMEEAAIRITLIPPYDAIGGPASRADIEGEVEGVEQPGNFRVVIYALTDMWYVQPLDTAPFTDIGQDGTWSTWTHGGTHYALLLVRTSYKPSAMLNSLPPIGGDVLATAKVRGKVGEK